MYTLWYFSGDESIGFKLEHIICIDEKVNVTVKCTVPYPINGIKIFLNESEISQCRAFKAPPYKFCKNIMEKAHQNAVAYLLDNSMFYTTEGAYNYIISKTVVCQNGGTNDVKYSLSIPNTICKYDIGIYSLCYITNTLHHHSYIPMNTLQNLHLEHIF